MKRETMKRETLTPAEQNPPQKPEPELHIPTLIGIVLAVLIIGGTAWYTFPRSDNRRWVDGQHADQQKVHQTYEQAMEQLQELVDKGCQVPFEDCLYPWEAEQKVFDAMDREKIEFGTRGVTHGKLDELEELAQARIASQKFEYLKANGGAIFPSELELLNDVCRQVYFRGRWFLDSTPPTDAELKELLPPGVTKTDSCYWDEN